jgi:hypothetical protein
VFAIAVWSNCSASMLAAMCWRTAVSVEALELVVTPVALPA